jgi:hypothetical protein
VVTAGSLLLFNRSAHNAGFVGARGWVGACTVAGVAGDSVLTCWTGSVCGWGAAVSSVFGVAGVDLWAVGVAGAVSEFVETDCRRSSSFEALVALALGEITGIAIGTAGGVVGNAGAGLPGTMAVCEEGTIEEGVVG